MNIDRDRPSGHGGGDGGGRSYFSPFSFVQLGRFKTFPIVRRRRWLKAHGSIRLLFSAEISLVSVQHSYLLRSSRPDRLETRIFNRSKNIVITTWPSENRLERYIFEQQTRLEFITTISPFIIDLLLFIECFQYRETVSTRLQTVSSTPKASRV